MVSRFSVVGQTGLVRNGDDVWEEWNRSLRGGRRWAKAVREMRDTDATIGASILVSSAFIRQTPWMAKKADLPEDDPLNAQADEAVEFLTGAMKDMSHTWTEMLSEMMSTMWFGWSWFEKVYKVRRGRSRDPKRSSKFDDGRIGFRKIAIRAQESLDGWEFDEEGNVLGMYQRAAPTYRRVFIPSEKSVLFRTELNKNNPEGRSMLRNLYRPYYFLKRNEETEAVGMERELVGLPKATIPIDHFGENVSPEKAAVRDDIFESLKHLRMNRLASLVYPHETDPTTEKPTGFGFELVSTGGRRSLDIRAAIRDGKADIARGMLTQFLFLGMQSTGSFALSSDMTDVFAVSLGAILDIFEETFNRFAVEELMSLNGFDPRAWATWSHGDIEKENLKSFAEMLLGLVTAGAVTPDTKLEEFVRQKFELPDREDEDMDEEPSNVERQPPPPPQTETAADDVEDDAGATDG